jgi:hypothetical protein
MNAETRGLTAAQMPSGMPMATASTVATRTRPSVSIVLCHWSIE